MNLNIKLNSIIFNKFIKIYNINLFVKLSRRVACTRVACDRVARDRVVRLQVAEIYC